MRKIIISMLVILLVFSELNVSVAEMSIIDPTESEIECEEQLETDSEENLPTQCEEQLEPESEGNSATEEEKQPEPESEADLTTEEEEQPESESEADLTTEEEKQPESESGKDLTTEGEEQEESESEENLANACERESESESEENLATEAKKQLESDSEENPAIYCEEEEEPEENLDIECEKNFYIEEELVTEEEAQPGSNSEEEVGTEGEEQLEPNSEEEPLIEGEEDLALDSEERTAPKCLMATPRSAGIPIKDVGKIGDIDFSKLDDYKGELNEFTEMTKNRGVEFQVKGENRRKHYMYFGDVYNGRSEASLERESSYDGFYRDDWTRPLPSKETTLESLVSGKKYINAQVYQVMVTLGIEKQSADGVVTYFFDHGRAKDLPKGSGLVIAHGNKEDDIPSFQSQDMPLLKLYKNETKQELIAYAAVINGDYLDGYVRIKMRPVSAKGRINVSMKYLKISNEYEYTNLALSVHMDIAGNHNNSKMYFYSLGSDKGHYFKEYMRDYRYYILYFFRDGYANHPAELKGTNEPINNPFSSALYPKLNSAGTDDPGKGKIYNFTTHPGWALRWEAQPQGQNEVREVNLEIAVTEKMDVLPEVQLNNDGEYTDDGYRTGVTWRAPDSENISLYYTIDGGLPVKIKDFKNRIQVKMFHGNSRFQLLKG